MIPMSDLSSAIPGEPIGAMKGYFTMPYKYLSNRNLSDDFWTIRRGELMVPRTK